MSKGREIYFVTWLRAMSVAIILLCHFASWSNAPLLLTAFRILNVRVPIFVIISGFLFGIGGGGRIKIQFSGMGKGLKGFIYHMNCFYLYYLYYI